MRDAALQAAGPHDQTHERAEDRALRVGSSGRWSMRPPTEAALLLAAYIADDARYALNKFCKPTVVFERIEFAFFLLIIAIIAKNLATPPYKNVFGIWHFVRHKRLRRPYLSGRFSSFDKSDRKSASARFPANFAAMSDWNPSPVILMPKGILLRRISQLQRSGRSLC